MVGDAVQAPVAEGERSRSWRSVPRWPDGRLFHAMEDRMTRVAVRLQMLSLALFVWAFGRSDLFEAAVDDARWILVGALVVVSVLSFYVGSRLVWTRAARSGAGVPTHESARQRPPVWWRAPRWPDGRLFAVRDMAVMVAWLVSIFAAGAVLWLCGDAGIPSIEISAFQEPLVSLLQLATVSLTLVVAIRMRVVQAVVEGWVDDDRVELDFFMGRIAALAVDARRAKARFAPSRS